MSNRLIIYEPEEGENLVTNPRFENGVDGYFDNGSTILRSLSRARWGRASLEIVTDGAGLLEGAYFRFDPQTQNTMYGASVYVRGTGSVRARLADPTNGIEYVSETITLDDNHWIRFEVLGRTGGNVSNDLRLYVETVGTIQSVTFYIDGLQIEPSSHVTTYIDGDLEKELPRHEGDAYFRWSGTRNASSSTRSVRFRPAGNPRVLEFDDVGVYITQGSGLGMAPIRLNIQDLGAQNRAIVQSFKAQARSINLVFWARKEPQTQVCTPASLRELHILRERLEALIKPDRSANNQPFLLSYQDGSETLDILSYYESGLEFEGDLRFPYFNSFAMRLLSVEPYWEADGQDVQQLTAFKQIHDANYVLARIDGEWTNLLSGATGGVVREFVKDPVTGDIFAVGAFTDMNGVANTRGIARWNGSVWSEVDGGLDDGTIFDAVIMPGFDFDDRLLVIGGDFTSVSGNPMFRIASYDIDNDFWNEMGEDDGLDDNVQDLAVTKDGNLYIGGGFVGSELGTVAALNLVCYFDAGLDSFVPMGFGPGLNLSTGGGRVRGLEMDLDGLTPMISGLFDREVGGVAGDLAGVATYDIGDNSFDEPGDDGADNNDVRETAIAPDGRSYAGGTFTNIGVTDANAVAVYTRQEWLPLGRAGDGIVGTITTQVIRNVKVDSRGRVYFGGAFDALTGAAFATAIGTWNGSSFSHLDVELPDPPEVQGILIDGRDIWIGHTITGVAANGSFIHTIENRGKASIGVILEVLGPARLLWLENQTTGDVIRMDLTVGLNETVILDFRETGQRFVSNILGNVGRGILPDSTPAGFKLIPGENKIAFFARGTNGDTEISLRWAIRNWSFDDIVWAQSTD